MPAVPVPTSRAAACPRCGGSLTLRSERAQTAVCPFCGAQLDLTSGAFAFLEQLRRRPEDTPLKVGLRGRLDGADFVVAGLLRWREPGGSGPPCDDWFLLGAGDRTGWLRFDGYSWRLCHVLRPGDAEPVEIQTAGPESQWVSFDSGHHLVLERSRREVAYLEGELLWTARLGQQVTRLRCDPDVSVEVWPNRVRYFRWSPVPWENVADAFAVGDAAKPSPYVVEPAAQLQPIPPAPYSGGTAWRGRDGVNGLAWADDDPSVSPVSADEVPGFIRPREAQERLAWDWSLGFRGRGGRWLNGAGTLMAVLVFVLLGTDPEGRRPVRTLPVVGHFAGWVEDWMRDYGRADTPAWQPRQQATGTPSSLPEACGTPDVRELFPAYCVPDIEGAVDSLPMRFAARDRAGLRAWMRDGHFERPVRMSAAIYLLQLGDDSGLPELEPLAGGSEDVAPALRRAALELLATLRVPPAVQPRLEALRARIEARAGQLPAE